jgi:DNA-binding SARP family transcriptional activator
MSVLRVPGVGVVVVLERQFGVAALLRIELFGGFRVVVGADAVSDDSWKRRRAAAVVKLLALAPGHRLPRERLMDLLWPEMDPAAAAANLRKAVHYARRVLGPDGAHLLGSAGEVLLLASADVWVDVDAFHAAVSRARRGTDLGAYVKAVELYGDGLLPEDRYEDWAIEWQDALRTESLQVVEELASMLEARGDLEAATRMARRLVAEEPTAENHAARLIRLLALAGRRGEALREYERLDDSLAELGVEPSPSTQRLYEEVRSGGASEPQLSAQLWERVGDLRLLAGDTRGAARAFGSALSVGVGDTACLHRKIAGAWLMEQAPDAATSTWTRPRRW